MDERFASSNLTLGQMNAIVKLLGGYERALSFLRGELLVVEPERKWHERDGIIYFSVASDGTTGEGWIKRLEDQGFNVSDYAQSVLRSPDFKPTKGVTRKIAIIRGTTWDDRDRTTKNIRAKASELGFTTPSGEVACLIRERFSDEEIKAMGLWWIVTMHEPIYVDGDPLLLRSDSDGAGSRLGTLYDRPGGGWSRGNGFAFEVPQVSGS
ncbi:MAG: hypothetical protein PHS07_03345 [Patescibacteria group bacterium]|nr:hypothetical protein [Patescibacteria group bacterium]